MVVYNFKKIQVVPPASDFLDIVLSKTQRKTPTVVHKGYQISRIRSFYMRKVKYAGQSFHDKLSQILDDFPLLNDIHPFYADLINVLYDRDHYKLALGHLNTCRHLIDTLGKDYLRLLKYGDSLYRCKQLKRAALGRMCTLIKSQRTTLAYLEEVRQHLSRLPSIDPNTRTIILCGYPNVGKSSFMNKVTRAEVDVQPYAFTTKSLFVGHTFHNYLTWQVIDTPGILDHPLEDRNTIEMQAITALAHLRAAVLYIIDISEQCGYSIKQQVALFESIKPLFSNKPLVIVLNKIDVIRPDDLDPSDRELLEALAQQDNVAMVPMSNLSEEGVMTVKEKACDALLEQRVEVVLKTSRANDVLSRIHVAQPISRDHRNRTAFFPETVAEIKAANLPLVEKKKERAERKKDPKIASVRVGQFEGIDPDWDPTKTSIDWRKDYLLKNDDWKFDPIPEIMDGYNIADFVDPDIEHMLELLEQEEEERIRQVESELDEEEDGVELTPEQLAEAQAIREKKAKMILASREKRVRNHPKIMRKHTARSEPVASFESHLSDLGIDASKAIERARSRSRSRSVSRSKSRLDSAARAIQEVGQKRKRSESRGLSAGIRDAKQQKIADNIQKSFQKKVSNQARKGESDRHIAPKLPKHLFSGKRKMGTHDRR